jgi:hypothetical protein
MRMRSRPRTSSTMSTVSPSTTFNTVAVVGGRYGGLAVVTQYERLLLAEGMDPTRHGWEGTAS